MMYELNVKVRLDTQPIPKKENFKFESLIQASGDINNDITHRIGVAWMERIACLRGLV